MSADNLSESEKVSTNKKRVQIFVFVSIGLLIVFLFIMTFAHIFSDKSKKKSTNQEHELELVDEVDKTKNNNSKNNKTNDFDKLLTASKTYQNTRSTQDIQVLSQTETLSNAGTINPYEKQKADNFYKKNNNNNQVSVNQDQLDKYKEQEKLRGLMSNRAAWFSSKVTNKNTNNNPYTQTTSESNINQMQSKTIDEKRAENKARIENAQLMLKQAQYYKETGDTRGFENIHSSLMGVKESFNPPPVDISGYTKENIYNADIDGKHKIPVGTVIPAFTIMKTISDYHGTFKAMIDNDVYDSTSRYVLLPKGTEFIIKSVQPSGVNQAIENRVGFTVTWAVLPNGNKIDFSKSSGLDRQGVGAVNGDVNYHFLTQFLGVAAYALISGESSRSSTNYNDNSSFAGDVGQGVRDQAKPLIQKYINIVPTITLDAGEPIRVILEDEIFTDAWRDLYEDYY